MAIPVTAGIRGFAGIPVPAKFHFFAGIPYRDFTLNLVVKTFLVDMFSRLGLGEYFDS